MYKKQLLLLSLATMLCFAGGNKKHKKSKRINAVYGSVNSYVITEADINKSIAAVGLETTYNALNNDAKREILTTTAERILLTKLSLKKVKHQADFQRKVQDFKEELALQLWLDTYMKKIKKKITQKEISNFYTDNKSLFLIPKGVRLRQIVLEEEANATKLIKEMQEENATLEVFATHASDSSIDPTAQVAGELGWMNPGELIPEVKVSVQKLAVDTFSKEPVHTSQGYHIFYLEATRDASYRPVAEVENDIREVILKERMNIEMTKLLKSLKSKAKIKLPKTL